MRKHRLQRGLYLITPDARDPSRLLERVLRESCADARVPFIVNDDARLAQELAADGVHLGEHDGGIAGARALLGEDAIIGVSCYDDLERARRLANEGADYLAFGAFFPSSTKPNARRADIALPRVAIGGITPDNASPLVAAGTDLLAVISGVFDAPDPIKAARAYLSCLQDESA